MCVCVCGGGCVCGDVYVKRVLKYKAIGFLKAEMMGFSSVISSKIPTGDLDFSTNHGH